MPTDLPESIVPLTAAERQRRYRAGARAAGKVTSGRSGRSGKRGKRQSAFKAGVFVAIDGEGFSEGEEIVFEIGTNRRLYKGREHYYALLAASDGTELYAPDGRLTTKQCLDFVIDIKRRDPRAIIVCFGGSYDMCHMLAHGLTREQIGLLLTDPDGETDKRKRRVLDVTLGEHDYRIEYRHRKALSVWRWPAGQAKYRRRHKRDGTPVWEMTEHDGAVVWDVWGFFQDTFSEVMRKWIPGDPDYEMIKREKGNRSIFARSEIDTIRKYNQAELRCLVAIMNRARDALAALDLPITRWDGAGAVASAMMRKHGVKECKRAPPAGVLMASRYAYSGGHIEAPQLGYRDGMVFHYDVNSAYPDRFRELPDLTRGHWRHGHGVPPDGFTVVRTRFHFHAGNSFYPLFFREEGGSIFYPARGEGWYWYPEFEAAREFSARFGARVFEALEWWHFEQQGSYYPFAWITDYYEQRQRYIMEARGAGVESGEEKIIKLGLNALYGKTAQQVGAREDEETGEIIPPAYFQLEWAGYVTAGCRAKLMQAAIQNSPAVIAFATDGLFTTEPLDLDTPDEKILGAWEFQRHAGITMVMPGVYWLHETTARTKHYSRGFDKAKMSDPDFVHWAWRRKQSFIPVDITRLIGLATACLSPSFWAMRGMFVQCTRDLALNGDNSKRYPVMLYRERLHAGLVATVPRDHDDMLAGPFPLSAPYEIAWLDDDPAPIIPDNEGLADGEMAAERDAIDAELA